MRSTLTSILTLARTGSTRSAWDLFQAEGLNAVEDRSDVLTLKGRLLKDLAESEKDSARIAYLEKAGAAYAAAAHLAPAVYPLINAATIAFLAGARADAAALAEKTLSLLGSGLHEPDTAYWLGATRAEALLLLGRESEAEAALRAAIGEAPEAWEDHAVTLRQFRLILAALGRGTEWLDAYRPPPALHFAGPIGLAPKDEALEASIDDALASLAPGTAIGALAAGFDIVAAERIVRAGTRLHLLLPAPVDIFARSSVQPAGADWMRRFEALLADATSVETLDAVSGFTAAAVSLAEDMAVGIALGEARQRGADAVLLRLTGADVAPGFDRPAVRVIRVAGDANPDQNVQARVRTAELSGPQRPLAFIASHSRDAERLAAAADGQVRSLPGGAIAAFADLEVAAETVVRLFDARSPSLIALDYCAPGLEGSVDERRLEALLTVPPRHYPIATRAAALALEAHNAPFRCALAGAGMGVPDAVDFFSLCRREERQSG